MNYLKYIKLVINIINAKCKGIGTSNINSKINITSNGYRERDRA